MIVHDLVDNICIDMSKINSCRVMKTCDDLGVICFESSYCSGYNLTFANVFIAKRIFDLMMMSYKSGAAYFDIEENMKLHAHDDSLTFGWC